MVAKTHIGLIVTALLTVGPSRTLAQSSSVTCLSSFNWMDNSKGQSPCLVAAYLQGACNNGEFTVGPLPPGNYYTGPYADEQNPCQCSSVTYSAISACGLCQNRTIISWSTWDYNCSTVYPSVFPPGVPDGTDIPAWMFQDVTSSDQFNATLAQLVGDAPEATPTRAQSTGSVLPTSTGIAPLTSAIVPSQTPSSGSTSGSSNSDTGAIVGGVVGGVVGVGLIAGAIVYFVMRHKRSRIVPSTQYTSAVSSPIYPSASYTGSNPFPRASTIIQPKLYDPSDPSTFPITSPPATGMSTSSINHPNSSIQYSTQPIRPGGYSGAPEV